MSRHLLRPKTKRLIHARARKATAWQHNGTWAVAGVHLVNTPTLGAELLTDPGLEAWTTATNLTSWTESIGGASTVNQETTTFHGGSNAARLDVDGSNTFVSLAQVVTTVAGIWYQVSAWSRSASGTPTMAMTWIADKVKSLSTTYTQYFAVDRAAGVSTTLTMKRNAATSNSVYFDDVSVKALTLNTLFAVRAGVALPASVVAQGTLSAGNPAGVVYGLDSIGTPTNGIFAIHDGVTGIILLKMVAGVWSAVLTTTATAVAGVLPQIKWVSANTFGLWYNGIQRGADQTISDAGTGTLHGVMSTSPLVAITGVFVS